MRSVGILLASALAFAAPAHAAVVFSDSFDAENGGASQLNYSGFANFDVTGQVDLVSSGAQYQITCAGGSGLCVDLDGTAGPGGIVSKSSIAFAAGDLVRVSFDLSGGQRLTVPVGGATDDFLASILFDSATDVSAFGVNYLGADVYLAGQNGATSFDSGLTLARADPMALRSIFFVAQQAGSFKFSFSTPSGDRVGPVLDNVSVDVSAVPEPATWGMMIAGFAAAGVAMRRRKVNVAFA